jgi:hypothetical protein
MRHRFTPIVILLAIGLVVSAEAPHGTTVLIEADPDGLVAHEWGTFTSVAAVDGSAVEWTPFARPGDLPCFVDKVGFTGGKGWLTGTVRMETPVIYFYSPADITLDVRVRFRQGIVTEWYPQATVTPAKSDASIAKQRDLEGRIEWTGVRVMPKASEVYPVESGRNHYYEARQTDASPIQVGSEREKFLFYRGVGGFTPPLAASIDDGGRVKVEAVQGEPVGDVMLFDNRGGRISHRSRRVSTSQAILDSPSKEIAYRTPQAELLRMLVSHGLFEREAKAMIETWRDSWFEEGTRLFYIVSRKTIEAILPLDIKPAPSAIERVFVGRIELLREDTVEAVKDGILNRDRAPIVTHGRFLSPILQRLAASSPGDYGAILPQLSFAYEAAIGPRQICN